MIPYIALLYSNVAFFECSYLIYWLETGNWSTDWKDRYDRTTPLCKYYTTPKQTAAKMKSATINNLYNDCTTRNISCLDHINRSSSIPTFTFFLFGWPMSQWIESLRTFSGESILKATLKEMCINKNWKKRRYIKRNWLTRFDRWLVRFEAMRPSVEQRGQKSVSRLDEKQLYTTWRLKITNKKNCSIQVTTFLQLACRRLLLSTHLATALISGFLILQIWIFLGLRDPLRRTNLSVFQISWKRLQSAWKNIKCYLNESNEHDWC